MQKVLGSEQFIDVESTRLASDSHASVNGKSSKSARDSDLMKLRVTGHSHSSSDAKSSRL